MQESQPGLDVQHRTLSRTEGRRLERIPQRVHFQQLSETHLAKDNMMCVGIILWAAALVPDKPHDLVLPLSRLI